MAAQPVEWALVVYYGPEAHRATYGRQVQSNRYTKDYIQLSRKPEFLNAVRKLFPLAAGATGSMPLTYQWPTGSTPGSFVFNSADRPHLKWETRLGAPAAWKMTLTPGDTTPETLPGDPSHLSFDDAENEFAHLALRGAGQPYLMAVKLRDQPRILHLRVYLKNPSKSFARANLELAPQEIQALAEKTSQRSALASSLFQSGGTAPNANVEAALSRLTAAKNPASVIDTLDGETGRALASYIRYPGYGLFFDPTRNHDAWLKPAPLSGHIAASADAILEVLEAHFPPIPQGDVAAETLESDPGEVAGFRQQIELKSYEVADSIATIKTRGSAQKAFADVVKANYRCRCAISGIATKDFLVASHIVPWSKDPSIRLDPSNGVCLSLLVDRAFENGYLLIDDDLKIRIDWDKVGDDQPLRDQLKPYEGRKLTAPVKNAPKMEYLQRRRTLIAPE